MRFPSHLLQTATFRSEPLLAAMAAIAVGMFVGTWIIGPAVTRDSADARSGYATANHVRGPGGAPRSDALSRADAGL